MDKYQLKSVFSFLIICIFSSAGISGKPHMPNLKRQNWTPVNSPKKSARKQSHSKNRTPIPHPSLVSHSQITEKEKRDFDIFLQLTRKGSTSLKIKEVYIESISPAALYFIAHYYSKEEGLTYETLEKLANRWDALPRKRIRGSDKYQGRDYWWCKATRRVKKFPGELSEVKHHVSQLLSTISDSKLWQSPKSTSDVEKLGAKTETEEEEEEDYNEVDKEAKVYVEEKVSGCAAAGPAVGLLQAPSVKTIAVNFDIFDTAVNTFDADLFTYKMLFFIHNELGDLPLCLEYLANISKTWKKYGKFQRYPVLTKENEHHLELLRNEIARLNAAEPARSAFLLQQADLEIEREMKIPDELQAVLNTPLDTQLMTQLEMDFEPLRPPAGADILYGNMPWEMQENGGAFY